MRDEIIFAAKSFALLIDWTDELPRVKMDEANMSQQIMRASEMARVHAALPSAVENRPDRAASVSHWSVGS